MITHFMSKVSIHISQNSHKLFPTILLCVLFYENYIIAKISCVCPIFILHKKSSKHYLCTVIFEAIEPSNSHRNPIEYLVVDKF